MRISGQWSLAKFRIPQSEGSFQNPLSLEKELYQSVWEFSLTLLLVGTCVANSGQAEFGNSACAVCGTHELTASPAPLLLVYCARPKNIQLEKEIQTQQQNATLSVFDPNETIAGIWKQRSWVQDQGEKGKTLNSCLRRFLSPGGAEWHRLEPPLLSEKRCQEEELPWLASYRTGGGVFANYCLAAAEFLIPWQPSTPGLFWVDQIIQVTKTLKTKTKQKYRLRGFRELPLGQWSDFGTDVGVFC